MAKTPAHLAARSENGREPGRLGLWLAAAVVGAVLIFGLIAGREREMEAGALQAAQATVREAALGMTIGGDDVAKAVRELKLVTVRIDTAVKVESLDESWRGNVVAIVKAPARLHYGVDLSNLEVSRIGISPISGAVVVTIPKPERIATEVFTDRETIEVTTGWARLRTRAGEYQLGLARRQLHAQARWLRLSREDTDRVADSTRDQVSDLVRRFVGPGVGVVVRIDE